MTGRELNRLAGGAAIRSRRAAGTIADAAAAAGLLDVAYDFAESPFGPLLVAVTPRGVVTIAYPGDEVEAELDRLARAVSPRLLRSASATDEARRELDEYFSGRRREFAVGVDLRLVRGFTRRVLEHTARIPYGDTSSYREVAKGAGSPRAMRAAGNALASNPVPIVVPCHRVLHSSGGLGGYTGGLDRKVALLRLEGALAAPA